MSISSILGLCLLASVGRIKASYVPLEPLNITTLKSSFGSNISVSYKETFDCEASPDVKSYAGYIHLPPTATENYPMNIFFLYYEAREDPRNAPLTLWLSGGPGESSTMAAYGENGPCIAQADSKTTKFNPLSWNNHVNMLYIDQPIATGFSYDYLVNGTSNKAVNSFDIEPQDFSSGVSVVNLTFSVGTFASQLNTANSTGNAAMAIWTFMQVFVRDFPGYHTQNDKISIWSQSYGGLYASAFASYISKQNAKIKSDCLSGAHILNLHSVGIINGYIDMAVQILAYPQFAYNRNTYGVQRISRKAYLTALAAYPTCLASIAACRAAESLLDPIDTGTSDIVNGLCESALFDCNEQMQIIPYSKSGYSYYDIARTSFTSQWPRWATGYLNQASVQQSLGVPLNFTENNNFVFNAFAETGDGMRGGHLTALASLIDSGVRVALIYGDRDYQCNWLGGERISLTIPSRSSTAFSSAGYTDMLSGSKPAGKTRQDGDLSFTRVYEAGHEVPYDKPQVVYDIFMRTILGKDVATGKQTVTSTYSTKGLRSIANVTNNLPRIKQGVCYLWSIGETCDETVYDILMAGLAVVRDFIVIGYQSPTRIVEF